MITNLRFKWPVSSMAGVAQDPGRPIPSSTKSGGTESGGTESRGTAPARRRAPTHAHRRMRPGWFSWIFVVLSTLAIVWIGASEIGERLEDRQHLPLSGVSLTIEPIVVGYGEGGAVLDVAVSRQQTVAAGDLIATLQPRPGSPSGPDPIDVQAPTSGTIIDIVQAGTTVTGSDPIVRLYRPEDSYLRVGIDFETLSELTIGMSATLQHRSIGTIKATLERVETRLPAGPGDTVDGAVLILRPENPDLLRSIVPGLTLDGYIDLSSGPAEGIPAVSSFGAGG